MTLLDPPPAKPEKSRAIAFAIVALAFAAAIVLYFVFRYYPEKRAADQFLSALVAGDTERAYQLWKPSSSYHMSDFLADWGPNGYYGPVKSYKIIKERSPLGVSAVIVTAEISPYSPMPDVSDAEKSRKTRVVELWVDPKDKSFSFQP
jgi:hypothetical protein